MTKVILILVFLVSNSAWTRQVEGRPTVPSDCGSDETWVTDHSKSIGEWRAHCRKLKGQRSKSYSFWAGKLKTGRPLDWPYSEETVGWTTKDVSDLLWATSKIPLQLWLPSVKGIFRMQKSVDSENPGATHKDNIVLYDSAFQNEEYVLRVLSHELAHEKFISYAPAKRRDYALSAGWRVRKLKGNKEVFSPPKCCFVQSDGIVSTDEDFANNVEYYLVEPNRLKKINPRAFRWIQRNMGSDFKLGGRK